MKSKERPWVLTKEDLIYEVKKDHEDPKSQKEGKKKEIIIIIIIIIIKRILVRPENMQQGSRLEDMQQEEHQGPRTLMCPFETLRRGPSLTHGKTKMYAKSH